jgi:hypothetical protein
VASDASTAPAAATVLRPSFPCVGADLTAARACEQVVFHRRFGNTAEEMAAEYGPYESTTAFGAVLGPDGTALGAVRLIRPGSAPVKTLLDAAGPPWSVSGQEIDDIVGGRHTWDVASFGVDSVAAGADRRVAMLLLSVLFGAFRDNDVTGMVAMLDRGARRAFRGLGVQMLDLPGAQPAPYLGSSSTVPVYRKLSELHAEHAHGFGGVHQQVFHGGGIDGVDAAPCAPGSFALAAG